MEGSSGFQAPRQGHYQYLYQPTGQTPPFQGQPPANNFTSQPPNNGSKTSKWTDEMVMLMITTISYLMEAATTEPDSNKSTQKSVDMTKTGKWELISMVMCERGHNVTPQQCEDQFLEINKKYKQLIWLLGKPTSCEVFDNPILLDSIIIPEQKKVAVRKLLESDQFYYRELCSLHHNSHMCIPHDWEVRRLVFLNVAGGFNSKVEENEREVLRAQLAQLEEKKLEIQEKKLKLKKMRFEWLCLEHNERMEAEKLRLENERLKCENARLAYELKRQGIVVRNDGN